MGNILSKAPCNSDLFEGQAHMKLAEVIANEIETDKKCTILGIDGGWGAGKSNLVGMIEKYLTNETEHPELKGKYYFFTYDAWGHQNDLPRRSILEDLTSFLTVDNDVLNDKKWKERLDNLLAKKKSTKTKIVPSLNFAIITISLMVALTPVISAIADSMPLVAMRIVFTSLVYAGPIAFVIWKQIATMKKHGQKISCETFFSELFLLYKDKVKEDVKFETISEKEPSTKQFKEWMNNIDDDLCEKDKRLIIVIDNMDRLPKLKVQELWAAIHSFFSEIQYDNIKVIVPFDRLHIRNAFQTEDIKDTSNEDAKCATIYGDDFINKTFYIVYHVSPPILSGWKHYFVHQWKEAFGNEYVLDNAILQVYDMLTEEHTPRKIVAFINEFVTMKRIADEAIPNKYIALFIFGRSKISQHPMKEILSPSYLGSLDFLYKDDRDMPGFISSLYYQLPVHEAMDVVYARQFTRELDENALNSVAIMKKSGVDKFTAILNHAIAEVTNVGNAAMALQVLFGEETNSNIKNFWECLYQKDKSQHREIKQYTPYHKVLLAHISDKSTYAKDLIDGYHNAFNNETDVKAYITGIDELAKVKDFDIYTILEEIEKDISPKQFIELVDEEKFNYDQYGLTCENKTLDHYLSNLSLDEWNNLTIIPYLYSKCLPLSSLQMKIEESLKNNNLNAKNAEILFSRLKELRKNNTINYRDYFDDRKLENLFNEANDDFKYDLLAMRLSRLNDFSNSYNYFLSSLSSTDENTIKGVVKVSNHYVSYGEMLLSLDSFDNELVRGVCKKITTNSFGTQTMSIKNVAFKFDKIINNSEISSEELLSRMDDWSEYKENIRIDDVPNLPMEIFDTAKKSECVLAEYILDIAVKYLLSINQEDWKSNLIGSDDFALNLLEICHPVQMQLFFDAFKAIMKDYAMGASETKLPKSKVEKILSISNDLNHEVGRLFIDVRDIFLNSSISKEKLLYFGEWLFKYGNLTKKKGSLEKILPTEILDDELVVELLCQQVEVVKGMVAHSEDPAEFLEKMRLMAEGNYTNETAFIDLCKNLGISFTDEK